MSTKHWLSRPSTIVPLCTAMALLSTSSSHSAPATLQPSPELVSEYRRHGGLFDFGSNEDWLIRPLSPAPAEPRLPESERADDDRDQDDEDGVSDNEFAIAEEDEDEFEDGEDEFEPDYESGLDDEDSEESDRIEWSDFDPSSLVALGSTDCSRVVLSTTNDRFDSVADVGRFLAKATFGPLPEQLDCLLGSSPSVWFRNELDKPATLVTPYYLSMLSTMEAHEAGVGFDDDEPEAPSDDDFREGDDGFDEDPAEEAQEVEDDADDDADAFDEATAWVFDIDTSGFWRAALNADDQLRQRVAFALSQILVVSDAGGEALADYPEAMVHYQDILLRNAFGNYRDLLEEITYSPAMAYYLTYLGNDKGDPATGRVPDENYARELLQLFTIGLSELNPDGTPLIDSNGAVIETYSNADITGIARVFTGLGMNMDDGFDISVDDIETIPESANPNAWREPLRIFPEHHSALEKRFLGTRIPPGTAGDASIAMALDAVFAHPNVGPFIGRQLIQRLVSSHPSPGYVSRVARAFDEGYFELPDGHSVGSLLRGDLAATVAAVLFDQEAFAGGANPQYPSGKLREPILRVTAWARAFGAHEMDVELIELLYWLEQSDVLGQQAHKSPSVFNFYRPGYVAPGTRTGNEGLTIPEFQLVNAVTTPAYINTMTWFVMNEHIDSIEWLAPQHTQLLGIRYDADQSVERAVADYDELIAVAADDPSELINQIDRRLTYGQLGMATRNRMLQVINGIPSSETELRAMMAVIIALTSTDFLVQR